MRLTSLPYVVSPTRLELVVYRVYVYGEFVRFYSMSDAQG